MGRIIAMTDIHGCLTELKELLALIKPTAEDTIIILGDFVDRGPNSNEVCEYLSKLGNNFEFIVGNHDNRYIRFHKYEQNQTIKNPMTLIDKHKQVYESLTKDSLEFLSTRLKPFVHKIINGKPWIFVHAGIPAHFRINEKLDNKLLNKLLHYRYIDKDSGRMVKLDSDYNQPKNSVFWTQFYEGEYNVVYGHNVHETIRYDINSKGFICVGIDTGCVFGGALTAFEPATNTIWSVKAKKVYYSNKNHNFEQ
jgi:hypothetical protein